MPRRALSTMRPISSRCCPMVILRVNRNGNINGEAGSVRLPIAVHESADQALDAASHHAATVSQAGCNSATQPSWPLRSSFSTIRESTLLRPSTQKVRKKRRLPLLSNRSLMLAPSNNRGKFPVPPAGDWQPGRGAGTRLLFQREHPTGRGGRGRACGRGRCRSGRRCGGWRGGF